MNNYAHQSKRLISENPPEMIPYNEGEVNKTDSLWDFLSSPRVGEQYARLINGLPLLPETGEKNKPGTSTRSLVGQIRQGATVKESAKNMGISKSAAISRLRRAGLYTKSIRSSE
jgi:hypothetical protein